MDNNRQVVGSFTSAPVKQPGVPEEHDTEQAVPDAPLRSEQRATPLLVRARPTPGGTVTVSGTGPRFREDASASSEEGSIGSEESISSEVEDSLDAAIYQQDAAAVVRALRACPDIRQQAMMKPLLLQALAGDGHLEGVRLLLDAHADVDVRCNRRRTPLIYAAAGGSAEVIRTLLDHEAKPGKRDDAGNTALHVAVLGRRHAAAAALLARMHPQEIDQPNLKGCSALFEAVSLEDATMTRLLLQGRAQVDCRWRQESDITPLMLAAARGNAELLQDLLAAGANPGALGGTNVTALILAVRGGSLACVKALLAAGADVDAHDHYCFTPLLYAVEQSRTDMVHALLGRGAAMTHHARMVRGIGEARCKTEDAEFVDEDGPCRRTLVAPRPERVPQPALLLAVCKGLDDMAGLLIDCGADVNVVAANGDTALAKANELGHHAIVERLLAHGARQ
jgi:ankyrin repeat protein